MATPNEISKVLLLLQDNYQYFKPTNPTALAESWQEKLADIPGRMLTAAADIWILESKWFPSIAELRDAAAKGANLPNSRDFSSVPEHHFDFLAGEMIDLEDRFYRGGRVFDEQVWVELAHKFERSGRFSRAEYTLVKMNRLKSILAQEEQASEIFMEVDVVSPLANTRSPEAKLP